MKFRQKQKTGLDYKGRMILCWPLWPVSGCNQTFVCRNGGESRNSYDGVLYIVKSFGR